MPFHNQSSKKSLIIFILISLVAVTDIIADRIEGTNFLHMLLEIMIFFIALVSATSIFIHLMKETKESKKLVKKLTLELVAHCQQIDSWKEENKALLEGLGVFINRQFEIWELTSTEKEIALFLLKGLSHKEIAFLRHVNEATARQQATSIYKKTGLTGRHALAAFFLEDLALPIERD